ncbi:helix-turn-helix domain-containing protein [Spirosoma sp. KUDC1026]|uniref:helix-turn-helix domain-containing protein n=1 Tax=Spirosoma sp. KUDC1026 TaxID=2745947 RepID=UPI00159BB489|nr:helix-turn-helix transcriptional regulator [Spirosoma sp. KUDC1026]QKZ15571.1 helix-turn-helix transcriptional regulator [Spirosoma sp. KUDC1026]
MNVSFFDLLILLGSLQGVILAVLLWRNRQGNSLANRLLAALMAILAAACFSIGVPLNQWTSTMLDLVPLIIVMPVGPIIYFYTKASLDPNFQLGRRQQLHFLPAILDISKQGIIWVYLIALWTGLTSYENRGWWADLKNGYDTLVDIPGWLSLTFYLGLAQRRISQHKRINPHPSTEANYQLRWLHTLLNVWCGFQLLWLLFLIPYLLPDFRNTLLNRVGYYPLYIPLAGLIYWIGLRGYLHTLRTFEPQKRKEPTPARSAGLIETTLQRLQQAMQEDRLYLDAELTVERVGKHLGIAPKLISAVLNQHLGKSFNAFINEYRVAALQAKLLDPAHQTSTILGLAYDCGFNSQATFQRAFRGVTGQTPKQYLQNEQYLKK